MQPRSKVFAIVQSGSPIKVIANSRDTMSKPLAIDHLAVDLKSYSVDVGDTSESHFKTKHSHSFIGVNGYTVFRLDRVIRRLT